MIGVYRPLSRVLGVLAASACGLAVGLLLTVPASARGPSDTDAPSLTSISINPVVVDAATSDQVVTVTARADDDLSGIAYIAVGVRAPVSQQSAYGSLTLVSADTYEGTLTIPQFAESGVWVDWTVSLTDNAGNFRNLDIGKLRALGFNIALGIGTYPASFAREFRRLQFYPTERRPRFIIGSLERDKVSPCVLDVPITLQRRLGGSGWTTVQESFTNGRLFRFDLGARTPGTYRVVAPRFGVGVPTLTTCLKAVVVGPT